MYLIKLIFSDIHYNKSNDIYLIQKGKLRNLTVYNQILNYY